MGKCSIIYAFCCAERILQAVKCVDLKIKNIPKAFRLIRRFGVFRIFVC